MPNAPGSARLRGFLAPLGGVVLVVSLVPPVATLAGRYAWVEALQYCVFAVVVPALVVLGAPWRRLGLHRVCETMAMRRLQSSNLTVFAWWVPALAVFVAWRLPVLVDRLATHEWLVLVEAVTLLVAGTAIWLELVTSRPFVPRLTPLGRVPVAAVTMWTIWILGYVVGLATSDTYPAFVGHAGHAGAGATGGLSAAADQQITAAVMWFVAAAAFVPVVFANLMAWLKGHPPEHS